MLITIQVDLETSLHIDTRAALRKALPRTIEKQFRRKYPWVVRGVTVTFSEYVAPIPGPFETVFRKCAHKKVRRRRPREVHCES